MVSHCPLHGFHDQVPVVECEEMWGCEGRYPAGISHLREREREKGIGISTSCLPLKTVNF